MGWSQARSKHNIGRNIFETSNNKLLSSAMTHQSADANKLRKAFSAESSLNTGSLLDTSSWPTKLNNDGIVDELEFRASPCNIVSHVLRTARVVSSRPCRNAKANLTFVVGWAFDSKEKSCARTAADTSMERSSSASQRWRSSWRACSACSLEAMAMVIPTWLGILILASINRINPYFLKKNGGMTVWPSWIIWIWHIKPTLDHGTSFPKMELYSTYIFQTFPNQRGPSDSPSEWPEAFRPAPMLLVESWRRGRCIQSPRASQWSALFPRQLNQGGPRAELERTCPEPVAEKLLVDYDQWEEPLSIIWLRSEHNNVEHVCSWVPHHWPVPWGAKWSGAVPGSVWSLLQDLPIALLRLLIHWELCCHHHLPLQAKLVQFGSQQHPSHLERTLQWPQDKHNNCPHVPQVPTSPTSTKCWSLTPLKWRARKPLRGAPKAWARHCAPQICFHSWCRLRTFASAFVLPRSLLKRVVFKMERGWVAIEILQAP